MTRYEYDEKMLQTIENCGKKGGQYGKRFLMPFEDVFVSFAILQLCMFADELMLYLYYVIENNE